MPEENASVASGFAGMFNAFIDPAATAKNVTAKLSWLWPLLTISIIYVVFGYLMLPFVLQLTESRISQQNIPPERLEGARRVGTMIAKSTPVITIVFVILFMLLFAWLIGVVGSIVGARAKFRDTFSLLAAFSLIPALQYIAAYIVLNAKGDEITTQEQMSPPFGLDIFLQDVHGPLLALLNYLSIFQIWYIVVLGLGYAALTRTSKGKGFIATSPAWVVPLLLRMLGAAFSRGS